MRFNEQEIGRRKVAATCLVSGFFVFTGMLFLLSGYFSYTEVMRAWGFVLEMAVGGIIVVASILLPTFKRFARTAMLVISTLTFLLFSVVAISGLLPGPVPVSGISSYVMTLIYALLSLGSALFLLLPSTRRAFK